MNSSGSILASSAAFIGLLQPLGGLLVLHAQHAQSNATAGRVGDGVARQVPAAFFWQGAAASVQHNAAVLPSGHSEVAMCIYSHGILAAATHNVFMEHLLSYNSTCCLHISPAVHLWVASHALGT